MPLMGNERIPMDNDLQDTSEIPMDLPWKSLEVMTNGFSEKQKIGTGGFGVVYKGVHPNGQEIAVKKLHHMPGLDDKQFRNELENLTRLHHRNIVQLLGKGYEEQEKCIEHNGKLIIVHMVNRAICLEYLHNGSLGNHLSDESSGLTWPIRYEIIKGICEGLKYLHDQGILHLDLKPANILLDKNMVPKIADFGLSRFYSGTLHSHTTKNFIGTLGYVPPEFIEKRKISEKFDVFSLGVIIIRIVAGHDGYSKHSDMSSQDFVKLVLGNWMNRLQLDERESASHMDAYGHQVKICTEIALSCVEADRHKRPRIADIIQSLNGTEILVDKYKQRLNETDKLNPDQLHHPTKRGADDVDSKAPASRKSSEATEDRCENPRNTKPRREIQPGLELGFVPSAWIIQELGLELGMAATASRGYISATSAGSSSAQAPPVLLQLFK